MCGTAVGRGAPAQMYKRNPPRKRKVYQIYSPFIIVVKVAATVRFYLFRYNAYIRAEGHGRSVRVIFASRDSRRFLALRSVRFTCTFCI